MSCPGRCRVTIPAGVQGTPGCGAGWQSGDHSQLGLWGLSHPECVKAVTAPLNYFLLSSLNQKLFSTAQKVGSPSWMVLWFWTCRVNKTVPNPLGCGFSWQCFSLRCCKPCSPACSRLQPVFAVWCQPQRPCHLSTPQCPASPKPGVCHPQGCSAPAPLTAPAALLMPSDGTAQSICYWR